VGPNALFTIGIELSFFAKQPLVPAVAMDAELKTKKGQRMRGMNFFIVFEQS